MTNRQRSYNVLMRSKDDSNSTNCSLKLFIFKKELSTLRQYGAHPPKFLCSFFYFVLCQKFPILTNAIQLCYALDVINIGSIKCFIYNFILWRTRQRKANITKYFFFYISLTLLISFIISYYYDLDIRLILLYTIRAW